MWFDVQNNAQHAYFQCDRKFYFKKTLIRHMKIDHGTEYKKFKCPEQGCNMFFRLQKVIVQCLFYKSTSIFLLLKIDISFRFVKLLYFFLCTGEVNEKTPDRGSSTWLQHQRRDVCLWKMWQKVPHIWHSFKAHQGMHQLKWFLPTTINVFFW